MKNSFLSQKIICITNLVTLKQINSKLISVQMIAIDNLQLFIISPSGKPQNLIQN